MANNCLVSGKFVPFHKGHQFLIETALAYGDVTVVIYDTPGFEQFPLEKRAEWISKLYPQVKAIITRSDPVPDGGTSLAVSEIYARDLEQFGPFTHVFSSEDYGQPFAEALGAKHVMVDKFRVQVPISGTAIRQQTFQFRSYVDPLVYKDLIQKVVFMGGESTGKTTMAQALSTELKTNWVHEFGRELWVAQGGVGAFSDLYKIGQVQYNRENSALLDSNRYLFCDTNPFWTEYWCNYFYKTVDPRLIELVERTKFEYIYFVCENDIPFEDDGWRETEQFQDHFHNGMKVELTHRGLSYTVLTGSVRQRVAKVKEVLALAQPALV